MSLRPSDSFNLLIGVAELRATASLSRITSENLEKILEQHEALQATLFIS